MKEKLLIVGAGWAGKTIATELSRNKKYEIAGFLDDSVKEATVSVMNGRGPFDIPVLAESSELHKVAEKENVKSVVIAITHNVKDHLLSEIVTCHEKGISVYQMPELYAKLTHKIPIKHIDHHWVIPRLKPPTRDFYTFASSMLDYAVSFSLFVPFIVFFPFIALAIKLDSKGPLFFFQKRVGLNGNRFTMFKFRTMTVNARKQGASWTTANDVRITRIGKYLRKFRIDELPQLVNVFRGEMALIGPRPEAMDLVALFKQEIPFYEYRYLVKPGITGWAQVNHTNTCSVDGALEKLQYDLYWIKNRSITLNVKIILKTIKVALTGFGSV